MRHTTDTTSPLSRWTAIILALLSVAGLTLAGCTGGDDAEKTGEKASEKVEKATDEAAE